MRHIKLFSLIIISIALIGCGSANKEAPTLSCVQLVDRNGVNETIDHKERLAQLQKTNFLEPQPYQKVVRVFKRDDEGRIMAKITSYHENSEPARYLETLNGRAHGVYKEWYANGRLRISAHVIEGVGDLTDEAQATWIFDGQSEVWDDSGAKIAEIRYAKGKLDDRSVYYHQNGMISKIIPYREDRISGDLELFDEVGELIGNTHYIEGRKEGFSFYKKTSQMPRREEQYHQGLLVHGKYWNFQDELSHEVIAGNGMKPVYEEGYLRALHEHRDGKADGMVQLFRKDGALETSYQIVAGQKQGEEWCYYDRKNDDKTLQPRLHMYWKDDEIHGVVRTWYQNGNLESEREMISNKKHGFFIAWYEDGSLMLIEEYDNDSLVNGKYMKRGEEAPFSRVSEGAGTATLFDAHGNLMRKVDYEKGQPVD